MQRRINVAMAKDGVKEFMSRAADALRDGYEYVDQDLETAREYYRIAAEDGDQHAQLYYGVFCKEGYGGPVDYFEAEDAFMQAAPAGSTPITLILGLRSLASVDTPVASPPPPIGTRI